MKIEHIAIWVYDLDGIKDFYTKYFNLKCGKKYENQEKKFSSYFLSYSDSNTRLELMHKTEMARPLKEEFSSCGFTHIAFSVGTRQKVDELTERLRADGYTIIGEPRTTGDGYYESSVLDNENNIVEITE